MKKRGLSNVVATVLIVLLALAAIAIIWSFIQPSLQGAGTSTELSSKCLTTEIQPVKCDFGTVDSTVIPETLTYQLSKGASDDVGAVTLILKNEAGASYTLEREDTPSQTLETSTATVTPTEGDEMGGALGLGPIPFGGEQDPVTFQTAVIVTNNAGDEVTCNPSTVEVACA